MRNTAQHHAIKVTPPFWFINFDFTYRSKRLICFFFCFFWSVLFLSALYKVFPQRSFTYHSFLYVLQFSQNLLERVVTKTEGYEVYKLEKLYALLCQSIYRHRRDFNKTALIQVSTCLIVLMSRCDSSILIYHRRKSTHK